MSGMQCTLDECFKAVCQELSPNQVLDGAMVLVHPMGNGQHPRGPHLVQWLDRLRHSGSSVPIHARVSLGVIDRELGNVLKTKVISGLDAVRALAVTLVLIDHFMLTDHLFGVDQNH